MLLPLTSRVANQTSGLLFACSMNFRNPAILLEVETDIRS